MRTARQLGGFWLGLLLLGGVLALLAGEQEGRWPGLAGHSGLWVAPGEVWTGQRAPSWIRTMIPGFSTTAWTDGVAATLRDANPRHAANLARSHHLSLLTLAPPTVPARLPEHLGIENWPELKQAQELTPQAPAWAAYSLAQLLVLPPDDCSAVTSWPTRRATRFLSATPTPVRGARPPRPARARTSACALLVLGADEALPFRITRPYAARLAHLLDGRTVLLEDAASPAVLSQPSFVQDLDGLQVYAGSTAPERLAAAEAAYRGAVAYSGGRRRLAAVAGQGGRGGPIAPLGEPFTLVQVTANDVDGLREGLDRCRTVAVQGLNDLSLELPQLGQRLRTGGVELTLKLGRRVERIELWREEELVRTWTSTATVRHAETLTENAVFSFKIADQGGVALTSGIWYEPRHQPAPDLAVEPQSLVWEAGRALAVVRNRGDAPAHFARVEFFDEFPFSGTARRVGWAEIDRLVPGEAFRVESFVDEQPRLLYVQAGSSLAEGSSDPPDVEPLNNAAHRPMQGEHLRRWELARRIRAQRAELRSGLRED